LLFYLTFLYVNGKIGAGKGDCSFKGNPDGEPERVLIGEKAVG